MQFARKVRETGGIRLSSGCPERDRFQVSFAEVSHLLVIFGPPSIESHSELILCHSA